MVLHMQARSLAVVVTSLEADTHTHTHSKLCSKVSQTVYHVTVRVSICLYSGH